tara:strand:- start:336 stop:452 length:117 start_codon:yes stop_codon:yes gene_type:complete
MVSKGYVVSVKKNLPPIGAQINNQAKGLVGLNYNQNRG